GGGCAIAGGDANADGNPQFGSEARPFHIMDANTHAFAHSCGGGNGHVGQDEGKFFTAQPGDMAAVPQVIDHQLCNRTQNAIAHGVGIAIIDPLEVVDVDNGNSEWLVSKGCDRAVKAAAVCDAS